MEEDAHGPKLGQLLRLLDEVLRLAGMTRPVDEPGVELPLRSGDRLPRLPQVGDIVERVVQPEDVDPALGRRSDEPAREIRADRSRADEKPPS